jgi:p-cumate 2,3-dioxygenase beta subunit
VSGATIVSSATIERAAVEDFLFREAALLDAWALDDWLALLTDDARYLIPPNDTPNGNPVDTLFTIADDIHRIRERVKRLQDRNAHAEFPHSRTRRMIANVRVTARDGAEITTESNFVVYRFRRNADVREFVGHYRHRLRVVHGELRIACREVFIDSMELGALGAVSFIL